MPADAADALHDLALAFARDGHRFAACGAARRALAMRPDFIAAHLTLGRVRQQIGDRAGAIAAFEAARGVAPRNAAVLRGLAEAYRRGNRIDDALVVADLALRCSPGSARSLCCLANAYVADGQYADAATLYRTAQRLAPDLPDADCGLGVVHLMNARWGAADAAFRRAQELAPHLAEMRYNRALLDLRFGRYREGFAGYAAIAQTAGDASGYYYLAADVPFWDGTPLHGRRLLIAAEQGIGDHLMMARFFAQLPKYGAAIAIETPPSLVTLYRRSFPQLEVLPYDRILAPSAMDIHLPIMHFPGVLGVARAADLMPPSPYLRPDPARVAALRASLRLDPQRRHIGIVWRGNAEHPLDRERSSSLADWAALAAVPGTCFHALQVDATADELTAAPFPLAPTHAHIADFDDTAALVTLLDLVITVDTATVHLAGALGRPTWLANAHVGDARWGIAATTTPWYPSLRIFRQPTRGAWTPVFAAMAAALRG